MTKALQLRARFDNDVFSDAQSPQAAMRSLRSMHRRFIALGHHHQQIKVATLLRLAPGVRPKQPHLLGFELDGKPTSHLIEQILTDGFHAPNLTQPMRRCKLQSSSNPESSNGSPQLSIFKILSGQGR